MKDSFSQNINLDLRHIEIVCDLKLMDSFLETVGGQLQETANCRRSELIDDFQCESEEELGELNAYLQQHDSFYDAHWTLLRHSFVIQVDLFFENRAKQLCQGMRTLTNPGKSWNEIHRKTPATKAKMLTSAANLLGEDNVVWQEIEDLRKIRNCIVHCEGDVDLFDEPQLIHEIVTRNPGIRIENDELRIEQQYCLNCLDSVSRFFQQFFDAKGWKGFRQ